MLSAARIAAGLMAMLVVAAAATARTAPESPTATGQAVVRAIPGFDGRWALQQWAPLRLVFQDPGAVAAVELFCDEAGPTFRAESVPAATGQSYLDLAVYAQIASNKWTVRLTGANGVPGAGRQRLLPVELGVDFSERPERVSGPDWRPDHGELGNWLDPTVLERMRWAASQVFHRQAPGTFGPPNSAPLVNSDFYRTVWAGPEQRDSLIRWPGFQKEGVLGVLGGCVLAVAAVGVLFRRQAALGALAGGLLLLGTGAGLAWWLRAGPTCVSAQLELVTRPGGPHLAGLAEKGWPAPVRRQRWICLGALRGGQFEVPSANPTPRLVVTDFADRPDAVLPAAFVTEPPRPGRVRLARGQFHAFESVHYGGGLGTMDFDGDGIVVRDWPVELVDAYLVSDSLAIPAGTIQPGSDEVALDPAAQTNWADVYTPSPADGHLIRLKKRLLEYWSTRTPRGGRDWVVGFEPLVTPRAGSSSQQVIGPVTLWAVDLGPIPVESGD